MIFPAQDDAVGRELELAAMAAALAGADDGPAGVVLQGDPGIGKTTLWRVGVETARRQGLTVSVSRPQEAEMPLAYCALFDLLEPLADAIGALGPADRAIVEELAGHGHTASPAPDTTRAGRAVLTLIRSAGADRPLMIAIDDVQWLDAPSERLLSFVARRLTNERVVFLLTQRGHGAPALGLADAFAASRCAVQTLEGLSIGGIRHIVRRQAGGTLSRSELVDLHRACGGNPMFALEFARVKRSSPPGSVVGVPATLRGLVDRRLSNVDDDALAVLQAIAVLGPTDVESVERLLEVEHVDVRVDPERAAGIVSGESHHLQFAHPLFASAVYGTTQARRRRDLHARAAEIAGDPGVRARHLALATRDPDEHVAAELERAAAVASARGAPETAAELADRASQLTPPDTPVLRFERALAAAEYLAAAGAAHDAATAFDQLVMSSAPVDVRAQAAISWSLIEARDFDRAAARLQTAIELTPGNPGLHAQALHALGKLTGLHHGDLAGGAAHLRRAVPMAELAGDPSVLARTLTMLAILDAYRGQLEPGMFERAIALTDEDAELTLWDGPHMWLGVARMWAGDLAAARRLMSQALEEAARRGAERDRPYILAMLTETELRAGNWAVADRCADEAERLALDGEDRYARTGITYIRGLVAAHHGRIHDAETLLVPALESALEAGNQIFAIRYRWVLGYLQLARGEPAEAWKLLADLPREMATMGIGQPGAIPVLPDAIETLAALDRIDEARLLQAELDRQAAGGHAWAVAAATRSRGTLALAEGDPERATVALSQAVERFSAIGHPLDVARSRLSLGAALTARRRGQHRREAAGMIEQAGAGFDTLGAAEWSKRAAERLRATGARARDTGELTAAEARVAALVARGHTNKETGAQLFMSVHTVEAHLTSVYRKVGIRSRTELTRAVAAGSVPGVKA
jgi:DNA-binding CsgD family transcriptional regulator/tetratricopeptide (TPR) repeat protein